MTLPNDATKTEQTADQEPEGIRRLREEYSPEVVEEILAGIRRGIDDAANGRVISLEQYMTERGLTKNDARK